MSQRKLIRIRFKDLQNIWRWQKSILMLLIVWLLIVIYAKTHNRNKSNVHARKIKFSKIFCVAMMITEVLLLLCFDITWYYRDWNKNLALDLFHAIIVIKRNAANITKILFLASSTQDFILQGMQQKIQKSCVPYNKNTWHAESN